MFNIIINIDEEINGGNVTMTFRYGYNVIVIKKTLDLCDLVEENGLNCPIQKDMISLGVQANIPATLPSVCFTSFSNNYKYLIFTCTFS